MWINYDGWGGGDDNGDGRFGDVKIIVLWVVGWWWCCCREVTVVVATTVVVVLEAVMRWWLQVLFVSQIIWLIMTIILVNP